MSRSESRTPSRRKRAQLYRKAARHMEIGTDYNKHGPVGFACFALELAETGAPMFHEHSSLCAPMKEVFNPEEERIAWLANIGDSEGEEHNGRILALCFMAAMVEAGDA